MDIATLRQVIVLAETLHFGRAAERANVSTSALSRSIRRLEDALGARLFARDNRTVEITAAGEAFVRYARDAVQQWDQIRFELTDPGELLHGELSLYCSVTASHSILFELLNRFRPEHPGVEIRLQTGDPEHAIDRVLELQEDVAIAARPDRLPAAVLFQPIQTTPLVFIAATTTATDLVPDDWRDTPMILPSAGTARKRVDAWFRARGVAPRIYAQVAGNEAIVAMVSLGLGVGVVPQIVLENSALSEGVRILDISPELAAYDLGLFTLKRHLDNPLVAAFWSLAPQRPPEPVTA